MIFGGICGGDRHASQRGRPPGFAHVLRVRPVGLGNAVVPGRRRAGGGRLPRLLHERVRDGARDVLANSGAAIAAL